MRVIKGTGDVRRMQKGQIQVTSQRTLKCTHCGGQATPMADAAGNVTYTCGNCKRGFKTQRM